jgi:hypothetical protein
MQAFGSQVGDFVFIFIVMVPNLIESLRFFGC